MLVYRRVIQFTSAAFFGFLDSISASFLFILLFFLNSNLYKSLPIILLLASYILESSSQSQMVGGEGFSFVAYHKNAKPTHSGCPIWHSEKITPLRFNGTKIGTEKIKMYIVYIYICVHRYSTLLNGNTQHKIDGGQWQNLWGLLSVAPVLRLLSTNP